MHQCRNRKFKMRLFINIFVQLTRVILQPSWWIFEGWWRKLISTLKWFWWQTPGICDKFNTNMCLKTVNQYPQPRRFPIRVTLRWRHDEYDSVWNYQPHDCLLRRLFRHKSNKISKLHVTGLWDGNSPVTGNSPHKGPATRKIIPFDDVIMIYSADTEYTVTLHRGC